MGVIGFKDRTKHGGSSHTIVVASDKLEDGRFRTVAYEKYIPEKLPTDVLLLVRETGALYVGTGTGIKKVADKVKIDPGTGEHVDLSEYLKTVDADNKYAKKEDLTNIAAGKSAYASAVENGYVGSEQDWVASLKGVDGKSAYQVAVDKGYVGNEETWLASLKGADGTTPDMSLYATKEDLSHVQTGVGSPGKSAYEVAVETGYVGSKEDWIASLKGLQGDVGPSGANGKSAYQIAVDHGYSGNSEQDWLDSLKGKSAYEIAEDSHGIFKGGKEEWLESLKGQSAYQIAVENGYSGNSEQEWIASLKGEKGAPGERGIMGPAGSPGETGAMGPAGKSAYQLASEKGFVGDEQAWLASLKGRDGVSPDMSLYATKAELSNIPAGKSAYQIAVDNGYVGDEQTWLASLKGQNGSPGESGAAGESAYQIARRVKSFVGSESDWLNSLRGADGLPGVNGSRGEDGKSAYQIAVEKGFVGDEQAWLTSLKGQDGAPGESAYQIAQRVKPFKGTEEDWLNSLKGRDGITPSTENFVQKSELEQYVTLKKFDELKNEFEQLKAKVEAAHPSSP